MFFRWGFHCEYGGYGRKGEGRCGGEVGVDDGARLAAARRGEEAEDARGDGAGRSAGVGATMGRERGKGLQRDEWVGVPPVTWCSAKPHKHI